MAKLKIKKGDKVVVLTGRDKGKTGEVLKALPRESKVIVQGVNVAKRHTRPSATATGGIVEKEAPSRVGLWVHTNTYGRPGVGDKLDAFLASPVGPAGASGGVRARRDRGERKPRRASPPCPGADQAGLRRKCSASGQRSSRSASGGPQARLSAARWA